ncbi:MAG: methionine--tRNA ligase [Candidatus Gastranaerophilales bacterium]|nr:methionine--tRNA ligase [Candidatus Gastranaerophilales bacterium]
MEKFYITTAIDYVNGAPHIGHAYEKIATDVIARHQKQRGKDVYFLTGSDEHGIKIQKTAAALNMTPKQLCDSNVAKFKDTWELLEIDYDQYIRTTDENHEKTVQKIFQKLLDKGAIYKDSYTGLYCSGCECFLNEKDLTEDGLCPDHLVKPEEVKEENYFFKLTDYKEQLKEYVKKAVKPEFRVNEVLNQIDDIRDISVSRSSETLQWGIPVSGDDSQVIYVWIDALSNYITAIGYDTEAPSDKFKQYWPANCHMIGKDILKFHSIYWPAILMALDVELPETIFAHGWITIDEQKMGKSLGNVISPASLMGTFELQNVDPIRYFFMTTTPFGKDGNYSDEDFKAKVNSDLANNMGNLLNRSLSMLCKYFDGEIKPEFVSDSLKDKALQTPPRVLEAFDNYAIEQAAEAVIELVNDTNKYVNDNAPWTLAKEEKWQECGQAIYNTLETMRHVAVLIYPICPNIAQDIWEQLCCEGKVSEYKISELKWSDLKIGKIASKETVKPVFLRIDSEFAGDKKKK